MANTADTLANFGSKLAASAKSIVKMALQSRRSQVRPVAGDGDELVILGNGPSLAKNIEQEMDKLQSATTLAVNFAANADVFPQLRPNYYLLADPHFFNPESEDPNVSRLIERLNSLVDWPMTLLIPQKASLPISNPNITTKHFNFVGVEGFQWLEDKAFSAGLGMPRPRNVLIPAIMLGIQMGYKKITLLGADHSWLRTLDVDDENRVVSVQPHFYKDNAEEQKRVTAVYQNVKLPDILLSFHIAFKSYHTIQSYAERHGISIMNATPGSFIDAFPRSTF